MTRKVTLYNLGSLLSGISTWVVTKMWQQSHISFGGSFELSLVSFVFSKQPSVYNLSSNINWPTRKEVLITKHKRYSSLGNYIYHYELVHLHLHLYKSLWCVWKPWKCVAWARWHSQVSGHEKWWSHLGLLWFQPGTTTL